MKPLRSILDPAFKWTPSAKTDVRKTFRRIRAELKRNEAERQVKVAPMRKVAKS